MLDSLVLQLALWLVAAIGSVLAYVKYKQLREQIREKEARLPEACDYIDLSARLETARAELEATSTRLGDARTLIANGERAAADEQAARKWLAEKHDELLRVAALSEEMERLKQALDARQALLSEVESTRRTLIESNDHLVQENRGLEARLSETQRMIAYYETTQAERKQQLESISAQIQKAQADQLQLNRDVEDLTDRARKAEERTKELEERCTAARQQLDTIQKDVQAKRDETQKQIEAILKEFATKRGEAQGQFEAMQKEFSAKRDEARAQLQDVHKEIAAQRAQLETLIASRKAHEEHIAMLKSLLERTEKRLDQQNEQSGHAKAEDRYRDLWQPVQFPTLARSDRHQDEHECLERVSRYLKGAGLQFPERVVYSFHTALKVADLSPLVVLAGISGTGKSELPRRYAEAMGIHFVGIAVQPRWDSPQDLFGFFNYMEGRYKATDLARAMVQFEMFNRPQWPLPKGWNEARDDRMLLVLLDEMNLARVEYYFSEFLSKLEVRRGLDQTKPEERAKAEIAIDMGSLGRGEKPIHFYPGRNILFAGTMNEDESTQSLSDKVLDRACVLRFGRPRQPGQAARAGAADPCTIGLRFEEWMSWQRNQVSPSDANRVAQWTRDLNDAMEGLERPFGHRVALAMQSYVANYPALALKSVDRIGRAFADQIEQRILPKLRGIELDEAQKPLKAIRKVLQDCDDPKLLEAFDQGAANQQTFIWRGIDRTE